MSLATRAQFTCARYALVLLVLRVSPVIAPRVCHLLMFLGVTCQRLSTPVNACQRLSRLLTPVNACQRLSTPINAYQRLSTPVNACQRLSTPINTPRVYQTKSK